MNALLHTFRDRLSSGDVVAIEREAAILLESFRDEVRVVVVRGPKFGTFESPQPFWSQALLRQVFWSPGGRGAKIERAITLTLPNDKRPCWLVTWTGNVGPPPPLSLLP